MSIDIPTVTKIAKLARIRLTDDEKSHYAQEIGGIMKWIEQLQTVNTDGVEPLMSVSETTLPLRKDEVTDGGYSDAVVKNAPKSEYGCFVVPKVIE